MSQKTFRKVAILASSSLINLTCGTLYLFGAYSPQISTALSYNASQTSKIGIFAQSAAVISGPLIGKLIDKTGYIITTISGTLFISLGYLLFYIQFIKAYSNLPFSCFLYVIIGLGSTLVSSSGIKCSMVSFPNMKGLATALPITAYGASALFFSSVASIFFPGNTEGLLLSLSYLTLIIGIICAPMICMVDKEHASGYIPVSIAASPIKDIELSTLSPQVSRSPVRYKPARFHEEAEETAIYKQTNFWIITTILCICAGLSQMYIYSIGIVVTSLVATSGFISDHLKNYLTVVQQYQQGQVALLSIASCTGRLLSGVIADFLYYFRLPSIIILYIPCIIVLTCQILGFWLPEIKYIWILSVLCGFGYGALYSSSPILVNELWGINRFGYNWGLINLSPIVANVLFSSLFATNYDSNTRTQRFDDIEVNEDGSTSTAHLELTVCNFERFCYNRTFKITIFVAIIPILLVSWMTLVEIRQRYFRPHHVHE